MSNICSNCKLNYSRLFAHNNHNYCVLCKHVLTSNINDVYNIVACYSDMSQLDIIKHTHTYINKFKKMPDPKNIDQSVTVIKTNSHLLKLLMNEMTNDEKKNFQNIKFFFTNNIPIDLIKVLKFTEATKIQTPINLPIYDYCQPLLKHQKNIMDKYSKITVQKYNRFLLI